MNSMHAMICNEHLFKGFDFFPGMGWIREVSWLAEELHQSTSVVIWVSSWPTATLYNPGNSFYGQQIIAQFCFSLCRQCSHHGYDPTVDFCLFVTGPMAMTGYLILPVLSIAPSTIFGKTVGKYTFSF